VQRRIVVFLGPSLPREEAERQLAAEYRPPAKRGDITAAAEDGAAIIGLIDGVFFQDCSVGHREVLAVLRMGVRVVGASSMGALRAAELAPFGMEGVGTIYHWFASGELVSDDEVALTFDPIEYRPLSEPLVNIRATLADAEARGIIDRETARAVLEAALSLYFPKRTYPAILRAAKAEGDAIGRFEAFIAGGGARDLKREDALAALARIRTIAGEML